MASARKKKSQQKSFDAEPFAVKDCAVIAIATGKRAQSLRELRDHLLSIDPGCIYYHFWGGLLRPQFDNPEYNNDFAAWAHHGLHDDVMAERLGAIDPSRYRDLEELRQELIDVIEERLAETEWVPLSKLDRQFHFIDSQIVVFDTHNRIERPVDLVDSVKHMSVGSVYYHFIDARRRTEESEDDFRAWLSGFDNDFEDLFTRLAELDPYFSTLTEIRTLLTEVFQEHFQGAA